MFLFPDRMAKSMLEADQQNVMRTWAVHHFSPFCPIYVLTMLPAALVRLPQPVLAATDSALRRSFGCRTLRPCRLRVVRMSS